MLIFALGILAIGGLGLFSRLLPKRPIDAFEAAGASLLLGSLYISGALFALGPMLQRQALVWAVATMTVVFGVCSVSRLRKAQWEWLPGGREFLILLLVAMLVVVWQAFARPLGGDGVFNFEVRARLGWENGGSIPKEFYSDPSRASMHASYPLFVPLNQLWIYLCLGEAHQSLVKVLGVVWFAGAACLTFSQLSRATRHPAPGFVVLAMMFVVPMVVLFPGGAVWVWGDFPVGAMAVAALLYLAEYRTNRTGLACFVAMLAALPWIKREGLILGCALLAVFAWDAIRKQEWRAVAGAVIPFLAVSIGWKIFVTTMGTPPVGDFVTPTPALFFQNLEHVSRIVVIALRELATWQRWALLWPIALLAWIRILREPALARWRFAVGINVALIAFYAGIYLFSAWPLLPWHMLTSYPRLLLAPGMMSMVLIAVAIPFSSRTRVDQ
jgi:hypothetical protein